MSYNPYAPQQPGPATGYSPNPFNRRTTPSTSPAAPGTAAPAAGAPAVPGGVGPPMPSTAGPSATANAPAGPSPTGGHYNPIDAANARNDAMYDPTNPFTALTNAMVQAGINPFSSNPMAARMRAAAPGLANSFLMRNTTGQGGNGTTATDIAAQGGMGNMFSNFLSHALSGGGGGFTQALRQWGPANTSDTQTMLGSVIDAISADKYAAANNPAGSTFNGNVFAQLMNQVIERDQDNGAGIIGSLYSPFMTQNMGTAYGQRMKGLGALAPSYQDWTNPADNPFNYLVGHTPAY